MSKLFSKLRIGFLLASLIFLCISIALYKNESRVLSFLVLSIFIALVVSFLLFHILCSKGITIANTNRRLKIISFLIVLITILFATIPMSFSPVWNGTIPEYRNQYEKMTESLLNGHLYLEYDDIDPRLVEMENPYDVNARTAANINYHWDHAFYKGHYYMYFGVVPIFLFFIPLKLLTGTTIAAYHATQFFTAFFIIGLFLFFRLVAIHCCTKLSLKTFLFLGVSLSLVSTWYITMTPALYCTAISSGLCMEIWSLFFYFKVIFNVSLKSVKKQFLFLFLGALFGALAFGCRPPVALANIVIIPVVVLLIKNNRFDIKFIVKAFLSLCPYIIIGLLLMMYNYFRFDNPFEFGQSYQLTVADQHLYQKNPFININLCSNIKQTFIFLFGLNTKDYPGLFIKFPLLVSVFVIFSKKQRDFLKRNKLILPFIFLYAAIFLIIISQITSSPFFIQRYEMDIMWLLCICSFILLSSLESNCRTDSTVPLIIRVGCILTFVSAIILVLIPNDSANNFTSVYHKEILHYIKSIIL